MTSGKLDHRLQPQPKWSSSQRPLYPKCIWVDSIGAAKGGRRHFIFDHDIPSGNQSHRSDTSPTMSLIATRPSFQQRKSHSYDLAENSTEYLNIIGSYDSVCNERPLNKSYGGESLLKAKSKSLNLVRKQFSENFASEIFDSNSRSDDPVERLSQMDINSDVNMSKRSNDDDDNQLAERVLQWLDLAGGRNLAMKRGDRNHTAQRSTPKRRSVTAKEPRRKTQEPTLPKEANLVKRESIHHLSLTFHEDDAPTNQTTKNPSNNCEAANNSVALSFGDFFPITYRCSRKFLSLRSKSTTTPIQNSNIGDWLEALDLKQTPPKKSDERRSSTASKHSNKNRSLKKLEQFEGQYRQMIQRQILQESCNTQLAKRQLHIFMPNLPKKNSNNTISVDGQANIIASPARSISNCESYRSN